MHWPRAFMVLHRHEMTTLSLHTHRTTPRPLHRLWDMGTGQLNATLEGHFDWVTAVAISPDGLTCVSGSWDKTVRCVALFEACIGPLVHAFTRNTTTLSSPTPHHTTPTAQTVGHGHRPAEGYAGGPLWSSLLSGHQPRRPQLCDRLKGQDTQVRGAV